MSWDRTYSHSLAIGLDMFGAVILFNRPDLTISSLCRIVQLADANREDFPARLAALKLSAWQVKLLRWLAKRLDRLQTDHCEGARLGDIERAQSTRDFLFYVPQPGGIGCGPRPAPASAAQDLMRRRQIVIAHGFISGSSAEASAGLQQRWARTKSRN